MNDGRISWPIIRLCDEGSRPMSFKRLFNSTAYRFAFRSKDYISQFTEQILAKIQSINIGSAVPEEVSTADLLPKITPILIPISQDPIQVKFDQWNQFAVYIAFLPVLNQKICEHYDSACSQSGAVILRSAPCADIYLATGQLELWVDSDIESLRISLALYFIDPVDIGLHFRLNYWQIKIIQLHVSSHGECCISHPVIVVGASWSIAVRGSHYSPLPLNVYVRQEYSVHLAIEGVIESLSSLPGKGYVFTSGLSTCEDNEACQHQCQYFHNNQCVHTNTQTQKLHFDQTISLTNIEWLPAKAENDKDHYVEAVDSVKTDHVLNEQSLMNNYGDYKKQVELFFEMNTQRSDLLLYA